MRKKLLLMLVLSILLASTLVGCSQASSSTPSTLTILSITKGNVLVMKAGTGSWTEAQVGMSLEVGDIIKTGDDSNAQITFFDGSTIELQAGTEIEIVSLDISDTGSTTITLEQTLGTTISRVTKLLDPASRYEVETPTGVAAVRGSSMIVRVFADGSIEVTNLGGEIWFTYNGVKHQVPEGGVLIVRTDGTVQIIPPIGAEFLTESRIAITKMSDLAQAHEGDTITYTYTITNPGNTPLSAISVTDDKVGNITYEGGYQSGDTYGDQVLDVGETWVFTATYNVTADDVSPLVNNAVVVGNNDLYGSVIAWASASVDILRPAIAMNKTVDATEAYEGDTVTYTYTITNPGSTPLSAILITDDKVGSIIYEGGYQDGDTNGDEVLDVDETWVFTATYNVTTQDDSPLVNIATASGTDALEWIVESEEATASVVILQSVNVVRFPAEGTAYIVYEDLAGVEGGDFDYNDFGMKMFVEEVYVDDCLTEINMEFESVEKNAGHNHDIHILRTLSDSTYYNYTITRSTPASGNETQAMTNEPGQDDFNIVLFDTSSFTLGDTVTIHIEITDGCEPYDPEPEPPRWDLASIWAYYDPYMDDWSIETVYHIGDWQPAYDQFPLQPPEVEEYDVPYILVIPLTDWEIPSSGPITNLYPDFDDYYATESPVNWYENKASS